MTFQEWLQKYVSAWYLLTREQEERRLEEWVEWEKSIKNKGTD